MVTYLLLIPYSALSAVAKHDARKYCQQPETLELFINRECVWYSTMKTIAMYTGPSITLSPIYVKLMGEAVNSN